MRASDSAWYVLSPAPVGGENAVPAGSLSSLVVLAVLAAGGGASGSAHGPSGSPCSPSIRWRWVAMEGGWR